MKCAKISQLDKPQPQSFISILYANGIISKLILNYEEQLILRMAVLYNNGIVNLLRRRESIKNLFNKGLLTIYNNKNNPSDVNNGLVCVNDVVKVIVSTGQNLGCLNVSCNVNGLSINKSQLEILSVSWCMDNAGV